VCRETALSVVCGARLSPAAAAAAPGASCSSWTTRRRRWPLLFQVRLSLPPSLITVCPSDRVDIVGGGGVAV